jgi:hypothetical protein
MDLINLAENRDQWRAVVNTVINLRVPWNIVNFLNGWATGDFSRRTHLFMLKSLWGPRGGCWYSTGAWTTRFDECQKEQPSGHELSMSTMFLQYNIWGSEIILRLNKVCLCWRGWPADTCCDCWSLILSAAWQGRTAITMRIMYADIKILESTCQMTQSSILHTRSCYRGLAWMFTDVPT